MGGTKYLPLVENLVKAVVLESKMVYFSVHIMEEMECQDYPKS